MSEKTKPIKRNPALVEFSKDHHFGLLLVWKIRQGLRAGIPPVRISNYVSYFFQEDLVHHFADEEQYLFIHLAADEPLRIQAEAEHAEIRALASSIRQEAHEEKWLTAFANLLEAHIRFEERQLFNHLQSLMSEDQLLKLLKEVPARPHIDEDAWEDTFWVREKKKEKVKSHAG